MSSKLKLFLVLVLVAGVFAGQHLSASPVAVPEASAACFAGWPNCAGPDTTRTSTLRVLHLTTDAIPIRVAPDTQDVWDVTAYYSPTTSPCTDVPYTGTFTVTNTGSGYSISCSGCAAVFTAYGICAPTTCYSGTDYEYTIKLDMLASHLGDSITKVNYSSSSIDDGEEINSSCNTGTAVSPTSQNWSANDTTFPCSYDCTNDTLLTILYN